VNILPEEKIAGDGKLHVAGEFECQCGAIKDFGDDFILPEPPYEIKCDLCGRVLIYGEVSEIEEPKGKINISDPVE